MGGAERQILSVLAYLDVRRFDPILICMDQPGELAPEASKLGFEPILVGRSGRWDVGVVFRLARLLSRERVSIVQGWLPLPAAVARAAAVIARVPVRIYFEGATAPTPDLRRARRNALLERFLAPATHAYIANSQAVAAALRDDLGVDSGKVTVIPNGVAVPEPLRADERARLRSELGASPDDRLLGMTARIDFRYKDHSTFLRTLARLSAEGRAVRAVVVGDGPDRAELARLANELGIAERTVFTGLRFDAARIYDAFDVSVLLSHSEGFSNVVLESMAAGVPLVATALPANREAIEDGVHGVLVPPGDPEATAAAIGRLLDDPVLANRLGEAARARAIQHFSLEAQGAATMQLYDELLLSRRAAR